MTWLEAYLLGAGGVLVSNLAAFLGGVVWQRRRMLRYMDSPAFEAYLAAEIDKQLRKVREPR